MFCFRYVYFIYLWFRVSNSIYDNDLFCAKTYLNNSRKIFYSDESTYMTQKWYANKKFQLPACIYTSTAFVDKDKIYSLCDLVTFPLILPNLIVHANQPK